MPGSESGVPATRPRYFAFEDGDTWLAFDPTEARLLRANAAQAKAMCAETVAVASPVDAAGAAFAPTRVTVAPSNLCDQACVYCCGALARGSRRGKTIDLEFCRAGLAFASGNARHHGLPLIVDFHGIAEPTCPWSVFTACVGIAEEQARRHGVRLWLTLSTGGQLTPAQAEFVAGHCHVVYVSLDGPPDIQRRQRPRRDGRDSFAPAARTATTVYKTGRKLIVTAMATDETANRLPDVVDVVADLAGPGAAIELGDVMPAPYMGTTGVTLAHADTFVSAFRTALERGHDRGLEVLHPDISLEGLFTVPSGRPELHMCLAYDNTVAAYLDLAEHPEGGHGQGVYGTYDAASREIRFDKERLRGLHATDVPEYPCTHCVCLYACRGFAPVRGRFGDQRGRSTACAIRRGVARELLRAAAGRAPRTEIPGASSGSTAVRGPDPEQALVPDSSGAGKIRAARKNSVPHAGSEVRARS